MNLFGNHARWLAANHKRHSQMKTVPLIVLSAAILAGASPERCAAADSEGVALAIIYDTSGSMRETVPASDGQLVPKYVIANRALRTIAKQIQAFATNGSAGTTRRIEAGLYIFKGSGANEAVKFGPFDAAAIEKWAAHFSHPGGGTPLGNALKTAGQTVLESSLPHKHVLIITDGINTVGPQPATVLNALQKQAREKEVVLSVHFVAFDVDANVFEPVKKLGATVVGAADEKQLDSQIEFILQRKILLEEEEQHK
jgi:hypothetical protein